MADLERSAAELEGLRRNDAQIHERRKALMLTPRGDEREQKMKDLRREENENYRQATELVGDVKRGG